MEFKTKNTNNDYEIVRYLLKVLPPLSFDSDKYFHHIIPDLSIHIYRKYETMEDKSDDALLEHITRFFKELMPSSYHLHAQDNYRNLKRRIDKGQELYKEKMKYAETKKQS